MRPHATASQNVGKDQGRSSFVHAPINQRTIDSGTRETLLKAIARSREWMEMILSGKAASFNDIAANEGLAERHVRRLAVLAFLSPKSFRRSLTAPFLRV